LDNATFKAEFFYNDKPSYKMVKPNTPLRYNFGILQSISDPFKQNKDTLKLEKKMRDGCKLYSDPNQKHMPLSFAELQVIKIREKPCTNCSKTCKCNKGPSVRSTKSNPFSSRGTCVITLNLELDGQKFTIVLVDMAGEETEAVVWD